MDFIVKVTIIHLLLCFKPILTKKHAVPDFHNARAEKLDECRRCRVLSDSFNHWLEKTARGKYEGGDTAWEEAKLKSYSRSEIRLVEIQEGLCSDLKKHQDYCYSFAEEVESVLEKWWFKEDPTSTDLYTWLCIDTLQHCCPSNHFGESCSPCLLDRDNNVCSRKGKCDGEGTRKGNGSCVCHKGYTGDVCNDCALNFFSPSQGLCEPCHKACSGCTGEGPADCEECNQGWQLQSGACVDVNECISTSSCNLNQYCVNIEGSYSCKLCHEICRTCVGEGPANCSSCETNHLLWSGTCVDKRQQSEVISSCLKRLGLYLGLLTIAIFIYRTSKIFASVVVVIIAVYIYLLEKSYDINLIDVISNVHVLKIV